MLRQKLLSWEAGRKLARRQVLRFLQLSFIPSCNVLFLDPSAHFISLPKGNSPALQRPVTCDFIGPGWAGSGFCSSGRVFIQRPVSTICPYPLSSSTWNPAPELDSSCSAESFTPGGGSGSSTVPWSGT